MNNHSIYIWNVVKSNPLTENLHECTIWGKRKRSGVVLFVLFSFMAYYDVSAQAQNLNKTIYIWSTVSIGSHVNRRSNCRLFNCSTTNFHIFFLSSAFVWISTWRRSNRIFCLYGKELMKFWSKHVVRAAFIAVAPPLTVAIFLEKFAMIPNNFIWKIRLEAFERRGKSTGGGIHVRFSGLRVVLIVLGAYGRS